MNTTIFSRIISGEVPSYKVYEDDQTFAFLDIHPASAGHTLVVPKQPIDHLDDCPPELYQAIFATVHKLSAHFRQVLNPQRIGLLVYGFDVPHAHVHIIPLYTGREISLRAAPADKQPDHQQLAQLAEKLRLEA